MTLIVSNKKIAPGFTESSERLIFYKIYLVSHKRDYTIPYCLEIVDERTVSGIGNDS